jgi:hypothetical protein
MDKKTNSNFIVDVKIHYQGRIYSLALAKVLRWLVPFLAIAIKVYSAIHDSSDSS